MNSAFSVIKAEYQINQTVVAAAIWLSFSDVFFSRLERCSLSSAFKLKTPGKTEVEEKKNKHEIFVIHEFILFRFPSVW